MEPTPDVKPLLHNLVFAVLFLILFVILLPPLLTVLTQTAGKIAYGVLVAGAIGVALRLRALSRKL